MAIKKDILNELRNKELTRGNTLNLCFAMKDLADALSECSIGDALRKIQSAKRYINEFIGEHLPAELLTEEEAVVSSSLHTYMRKGMDTELSVILYRSIAENKGLPVWNAFVKGLVKTKMDFQYALRRAKEVSDTDNSIENLTMKCALAMWKDDFQDAVEWINL